MRISTFMHLTRLPVILLPAILLPAALLTLLGGSVPAPSAAAPHPATVDSKKIAGHKITSDKIAGDYVEARTASVFAGGCHYNGELVTTGRDAILAWKIAAGSWKGTDLSGITAMAAISSDDNLQNRDANRQSELVINSSSTAAQATAMVDLLEKQCGDQLGKTVTIQYGTVLFDHTGSTYTVKSDGFAQMTVQAMPDDECCKQPGLVWYAPLFPIQHRKVGYTLISSYSAGTIGDSWSRSEENTAFYGAFQF